MFNFFKKHYPAIILALLAGILTFLPQILAAQKVDNFAGIYKGANNDESYYLARGQDIIDGHYFLANPYLSEYKNGTPMQFWLPDYLLARPLKTLEIDLHHGYFFYDFALPIVLALLTYAIIYALTGSVLISFLGEAFLHLNLFLYIFNRAPSPQLNFIFWLWLFWLFWKSLERFSKQRIILMGGVFGLLFNLYPYYWTFYVIFFALFLSLNFLLKQKIEYKKYFFSFSLALIIGLPYFISLFAGMSLPYYAESLARVGMLDTHFPSGRKIVMWGSFVLLFFYFSYKNKIIVLNSKNLFFLSAILAPMIAVNQHIITGKNLQFSSHYEMLSFFCFIFTAIYLVNLWLIKINSQKIKILVLLICGVYILNYPINYTKNMFLGELVKYREQDIYQQNYAPIFNWLKNNTYKESVVFASQEISSLIPVYTSNNVFYASNAGLHFMPNQEVWERFTISHYWDNFDKDYVKAYQFGLWGAYYKTKYNNDLTKNKIRKLLFLPAKDYQELPEEEINKFLAFSEDFKKQDFQTLLKKYRSDYLIWDKNKNPDWPIERYDFFQPLMEINDIVIYGIIN